MNPHLSKWQSFKQEINLIDFAMVYGYAINKKKSTKHSACLSKKNEDKIIVSRKNGIWVYFSVYDNNDNGTIVDFVKHKLQKSYADIFSVLDNWNGGASIKSYEIEATPIYDQKRIQRIFNNCNPIKIHPYLTQRGISGELLNSKRFQNTVFKDYYDNVIFPQYKHKNISALEIKNDSIHVFVKGSEKTTWQSNRLENDTILVIAESAIDAMSYHIIHNLKSAFYIAVSGSFSKQQTKLIQDIINSFSTLKEIRIITDNDNGGDRLYLKLEDVIKKVSNKNLAQRHSPKNKNDDWNSVLLKQTEFD